jgi:sugar lactone lactonase YvrE
MQASWYIDGVKTSLMLSEPVGIASMRDVCGEGAVWHPEEQAIYWTDINRFLVHRMAQPYRSGPSAEAVTTWQFEEPVTALNLTTREDKLVVVLGSRVVLWNPASDSRQDIGFVLPEWPEARCNDARVDSHGVLWIGSMHNNIGPQGEALPIEKSVGRLFTIDASGHTRTWRTELFVGNTMVWSPDGMYMYTADSLRDEIYRFDFHADSSIDNGRLWFKGQDCGFPDGSTIDAEGYVWNCRYSAGCILRIAPDGKLERKIPMPVSKPTTCVFGGADGTTLYITSASKDDTAGGAADGEPNSGGLFAIKTNITGLPPNRFLI